MTRAISMSDKVERYLQLRRGLGFQLRDEGRQLQQFAAFVDAAGHCGPLTTELAVQWARLPAAGDRLYWARRLEVVRCFARHLAVTEPETDLPAEKLVPLFRSCKVKRIDRVLEFQLDRRQLMETAGNGEAMHQLRAVLQELEPLHATAEAVFGSRPHTGEIRIRGCQAIVEPECRTCWTRSSGTGVSAVTWTQVHRRATC